MSPQSLPDMSAAIQEHARKYHHAFQGPIVLIGLGSIGRAVLPLFERHVTFDKSKFVCIAPDDRYENVLAERQLKFVKNSLTKDNYREVLTPLVTTGPGRGMIINLSVDTSSAEMIDFAQSINCLYIDTVCEPWLGHYFDPDISMALRTNYALREGVQDVKRKWKGGATSVSCCGANPGMVSWFVKQGLLNLAKDCGINVTEPTTRREWGLLMQKLGVKGVHIAERDTQRSHTPKPLGKFINTWSVEGFLAEALQPAELGWGTHEKEMPSCAYKFDFGCDAAVYLNQPGAATKVRSWAPSAGPQHAFLITHNEAISIPDYFTVKDEVTSAVLYRPTCNYAYHPCNDAILSMHEFAGNQFRMPKEWEILDEKDIADGGYDELGVLLYGHSKNAYWFGSTLKVEEARPLAPYQSATGLQISSAVMAGIMWMLNHQDEGVVETDEMDYKECLAFQSFYLGNVHGEYTGWTPLDNRGKLFPEPLDTTDPWQFSNILVKDGLPLLNTRAKPC